MVGWLTARCAIWGKFESQIKNLGIRTNIVASSEFYNAGEACTSTRLLVKCWTASIAGRASVTLILLVYSKKKKREKGPKKTHFALVQPTLDTCILILPAQACIGSSHHTQWTLATGTARGRDEVCRRDGPALTIFLDNLQRFHAEIYGRSRVSSLALSDRGRRLHCEGSPASSRRSPRSRIGGDQTLGDLAHHEGSGLGSRLRSLPGARLLWRRLPLDIIIGQLTIHKDRGIITSGRIGALI